MIAASDVTIVLSANTIYAVDVDGTMLGKQWHKGCLADLK
jgi:hypothetical protein